MNAKQKGLIDSIGTTSHDVGLLTEVIMTGAFSNSVPPSSYAEDTAIEETTLEDSRRDSQRETDYQAHLCSLAQRAAFSVVLRKWLLGRSCSVKHRKFYMVNYRIICSIGS